MHLTPSKWPSSVGNRSTFYFFSKKILKLEISLVTFEFSMKKALNKYKGKVKVNWVRTLFSASRDAHTRSASDWSRLFNFLFNFYNIAVRGSPVLHTTSLLPSQPKAVPGADPRYVKRGVAIQKGGCRVADIITRK